jgi:hypothetical protein
MPDYRIYIVDGGGHFVGVQDLECADDQEAIRKSEQAANGRNVELWERGRFIARYPCRAHEAAF